MGNLARFCIGMNMTTTLPLECFVCREVVEITLYPGKPFSQVRHVVVTSMLCAVALLGESTGDIGISYLLSLTTMSICPVSLLTCDLGIVLEITGGLSATALAFVV
jgi:solute carrier family 38 (sodium-coupled neutral amino acid transporter), member 11